MSMKKTDLEKMKGKKLTGRGRTPDRWGKGSSGAPAGDGRERKEPLAVRLFRQKQEEKK